MELPLGESLQASNAEPFPFPRPPQPVCPTHAQDPGRLETTPTSTYRALTSATLLHSHVPQLRLSEFQTMTSCTV